MISLSTLLLEPPEGKLIDTTPLATVSDSAAVYSCCCHSTVNSVEYQDDSYHCLSVQISSSDLPKFEVKNLAKILHACICINASSS